MDSVGGIYAVSIGLFLFSVQDVIIKSFSDRYSILQIVFTRSIVALLILAIVLLFTGNRTSLHVHKLWPVLFKGSCGYFSYLTYYLALASLPLADAATITFSAPIMVTVLSALLFREQVGWRRWGAVLIGFAAIVLVVGPRGHFGNLAVVLALFAAFSYAVSTVSTRFIDPRDKAGVAAFYSMITYLFWSVVTTLVIGVLTENWQHEGPSELGFLFRAWTTPGHLDQWLMILTGFIAAGGFYMLVRAYMIGEFSAVAPFEYLYIVWGALFGYLVWREVPSLTTILGVLLLVASNLYILRRELRLRQHNAFRRPRIPHR